MVITLDWLRSHGACEPKIALFQKVFGDEVELTRESIMRAAETNQSPRWLAEMVLSKSQFSTFNSRLKPFENNPALTKLPVRKDPEYTATMIAARLRLRIAEAEALTDILEL